MVSLAGCESAVGVIICALLLPCVNAYLMGGMFMWAPTGNGNEIRIYIRMSYYSCNAPAISAGGLVGAGDLTCLSGCSLSTSLEVYSTDSTTIGYWSLSSGRNSLSYTPNANEKELSFGYTDGNRFFKTTVALTLRPDTNSINSSPTVDMLPWLELQYGCQQNFTLPVYDLDGDIIRCRFAAGSDECGSYCSDFPAQMTGCVLQYTGNANYALYYVTVQIEDFLTASSYTPLSSVSLQFQVYIFTSNEPCDSRPLFVQPTPEADTCFPLIANEFFNFAVEAVTNSPGRSIIGIETVRNGPTTHFSTSTFTGRLEVNWTPVLSDAGSRAFCFSAIDSNWRRSEYRCVHLYVGAKPKLVDVRKTENGSYIAWQLIYDKATHRPSNTTFISIFEENGIIYTRLDATSNDVTFGGSYIRFGIDVNLAKSYYILLDGGIVLGGCRQPSDQMANRTRIVMEKKVCPVPPTIFHGTWEVNSTLYGSHVNLTCNRGYRLVGDVTLVCGANETWHGHQPSCIIYDCGALDEVSNGSVTYNGTTYGETAAYRCEKGFDISNTNFITRKCTDNGTWSGETPHCIIKDCNLPMKVEFAEFTYTGTVYEETVRYTCNEGYFLSAGNDNRRCEADAHWSGTTPVCTKKFRPGENCLADLIGVFQCIGDEFSCRFDTSTGNFRCLCSPEAILLFSSAEAVCLRKSGYGGICQNSIQCTTFLSQCIGTGADPSRCGCPGGSSYNETADECTTNAILFCPAGTDRLGLWWNKTRVQTTAYQQCPPGSSGQIIRKCLIDGTFSSALYNCTREVFKNINEQSNNMTTTATLETLRGALNDIRNNDSEIHAGDIDGIEKVLTHIVKKADSETTSVEQLKQNAEDFFDIANLLTDPVISGPVWESKIEQTNTGAARFIETIERFAENIVSTIESSNETKLTIQKKNIVVSVSKVSDNPDIDLRYPDEGEQPHFNTSRTSSFTLRSESITGQTNKITSVVVVVYRDISKALPKTNVQQGSQSTNRTINSQVMSIQLLPKPPEVLNPPIQLIFSIDDHKAGFESHCSFWKASTDGTTGGWSTSGCKRTMANTTTVQCSCTHLTNFAILTSPIATPPEHQTALTAISLTGCGVSIVCLAITLIIHVSYWRFLKGDRNILAMTVCFSLFVAYIMFVFGVTRTSVKGVCTTVAVLLHYTFLLVFFLLLAEAIYMALQVVLPFHKKSHLKELLIGAFAIPAVFVLIVASATELHSYGNDKYCWLTVNSWAFWMFVGPVLIVIVFNLTIIILLIKKMYGTKRIKDMTQREQAKTLASKTLVMLPVMGVTWLFGILSVHESAIWMQYLFVIFNSFQGLFIFIFHCVLNRQLRAAISKSRQQSSTISDESSRTRGTTDQSTNQTTITHGEPSSTVTYDVKTDHVTAACSAPNTTIENDPATIVSEEEKHQFKKRHCIPSQSCSAENKQQRPPTQIFINLHNELRSRLQNMAQAVSVGTNNMFSSFQRDTVVYTRNASKESLQKHLQDDQVKIVNVTEEEDDEDFVVSGGSEAETRVVGPTDHGDDLKEDHVDSKEDPKETKQSFIEEGGEDHENDTNKEESMENQIEGRRDRREQEHGESELQDAVAEVNSIKIVNGIDLIVKTNGKENVTKNDDDLDNKFGKSVNASKPKSDGDI